MAKKKKKIKLCMLSDIHSNLDFKLDPCDLLLIAGDLCPAYHNQYLSINLQANWLQKDFLYWFGVQPIKQCVSTFGNHGWIGEFAKDRIPQMPDNFCFLIDESVRKYGLKIHGTPWQLPFNDWAFNRPEDRLKLYWDNIPEDTDILLCHAPPYGILDITGSGYHIGTTTLYDRIMKIKPRMVVFGHNHHGYGEIEQNDITFINCSLLDEDYKMTNQPVYKEVEL